MSAVPSLRRMAARSPDEPHRTATPLELFMDLCFVVAVAQGATSLHHALAEGHLGQALLGYPLVFFGIWWAWMNFTWFASAYDNDDVVYRLAVFVQIAGVLTLAAGVPRAFADLELGLMVLGYVIMRLALVGLWLRAAASDPPRRRTAHRYALGITLCQIGWVALAFAGTEVRVVGFVLFAALELAVPPWAERAEPTTWHPHHIVERYGLFTIIVLGESILAGSIAVQSALDAGDAKGQIVATALGAVAIVCAMWWLYFSQPSAELVGRARRAFGPGPGLSGDRLISADAFVWAYGHYVVYASAAAVGAGIAVVVDQITDHAAISRAGATSAVAIPVALYILSVWLLHHHGRSRGWARAAPWLAAAAILVLGAAGAPILTIGAVLAILVATATRLPDDRPLLDLDAGDVDADTSRPGHEGASAPE